MPVQYTPQFIPTNTQALQGVLSEYQQADDKNLARELEVQDQYSMIPTITPQDTIKKNQILNQFGETMKGVEKKYNYDRASSAYSKELARKISDLRSQDFWSYNERKKEVAKLDQEMKARLGANYVSKYDPLSATYEDQTAINKYAPKDLRDLYKQVFTKGTEWANANTKNIEEIVKLNGTPIALERGQQLGFSKPEEVDAFLKNDPGKEFLINSIMSSGFGDMLDDPRILQMAKDAAFASLIGERQTDKYSIPAGFYKDEKASAGITPGINRDVPIHDSASTYGATKAARTLTTGIATYTPTEREIVRETLSNATTIANPGARLLPGNVVSWIATTVFPNKKESDIDHQSISYLFGEAITPKSESDPLNQKLESGSQITKSMLNNLGLSNVNNEEFFQKAVLYSMTGGEKNAPIKALEEITGKDFSKKGNRDELRDFNTWWESGGSEIKDRFAQHLSERRQKRVVRTFNWDTKNAENTMKIDFLKGQLKYLQPVFYGEKSLDSGTKDFVINKHMSYFDPDKLSTFMSEKGEYAIDYSLSGDDSPIFTMTAPSGKVVNFSLPLDRMESMYSLVNYASAFGDVSIGADVTSSLFNPPVGVVISEFDNSLENALINTYAYTSILSNNLKNLAEDEEIIKQNANDFFSVYDIRKTINNSTYQIKQKGTSNWQGEYSKQELFRQIADPTSLQK
jgi:hypothetical protein